MLSFESDSKDIADITGLCLTTVYRFQSSLRKTDPSIPQASRRSKLLTPQLERQIEDMFLNGMRASEIVRLLPVGHTTVRTQINIACKKYGVTRPPASNARIPESERQRIIDAIKSGQSFSSVSREFGKKHETIASIAKPAADELIASGALCGCGRPRWHSGGCLIYMEKFRSINRISPQMRRQLRERILLGDSASSIRSRLKIGIRPVLSEITAVLNSRDGPIRQAAIANRLNASDTIDPCIEVSRRDPLFARISAHVSKAMDTSLRQDIIADAYLRMLENGGAL